MLQRRHRTWKYRRRLHHELDRCLCEHRGHGVGRSQELLDLDRATEQPGLVALLLAEHEAIWLAAVDGGHYHTSYSWLEELEKRFGTDLLDAPTNLKG